MHPPTRRAVGLDVLDRLLPFRDKAYRNRLTTPGRSPAMKIPADRVQRQPLTIPNEYEFAILHLAVGPGNCPICIRFAICGSSAPRSSFKGGSDPTSAPAARPWPPSFRQRPKSSPAGTMRRWKDR